MCSKCDHQVAPGVPTNRPQEGSAPNRKKTLSKTGHTEFAAQTWYDGLLMEGNTSINPFFYGTYLDETKPYEPVTRTKEQAFQADAVGAASQLVPNHFLKPHTFRVEWQPGRGGRLDWYIKGYRINETLSVIGDGEGQDWIHAYSMLDKTLSDLMGSQIPIEPSYLIMNTAISSTWGFPYDTPEWCPKCYDCDDPKCACAFYPGFCQMIRAKNTTLLIDSIRIYQSSNASAHVGANHTLGCDPPDYPTKEWITGHEYRYMRNPPFVYADKHPLRVVQKGGGKCETDKDCGSQLRKTNWTAVYDELVSSGTDAEASKHITRGRGRCINGNTGFLGMGRTGKVCACSPGFTGPHCLSLDHVDDTEKAHLIRIGKSPFRRIARLTVPSSLMAFIVLFGAGLLFFLFSRVISERKLKKFHGSRLSGKPVRRHHHLEQDGKTSIITGSSI